ncbi:helix-turn-helix transcriptional regulator [Burkholderia stagnalis]|uniref:helix-turn-helix transcriptional regulator n=1 Tax=Burkholderia stagnalis TaxID=1503054 RepID=UPI001E34E37C|nr:AlpA family phage regulatory protein [Burkholderia stagnalis]
METGFIRQPDVLRVTSFSARTLWRRCAAGTFPKPVKLSPRVSAWHVEDVRAWVDAQLQPNPVTRATGPRKARARHG